MLNHWCDLGHGLAAMVSMRFEGLDVGLPFVDASVVTRPVETADLPRLCGAAMDNYGVLTPLYLRLWDARPDGATVGAISDRRFLGARLAELRSGPKPPPQLRLRSTASASLYDALVAAYAVIDAQHPGHGKQAKVQPRNEMDAAASAGTLFDVLVAGAWSGYVGAIPQGDTLGMPAWVVQELALTPHARGHGYGRHLSSLMARQLSDDRPVLVGTIHADSRGARAAALAAGRRDVGGWVKVPLPHISGESA